MTRREFAEGLAEPGCPRADLLALSPEALTLFSNVGLVKRAQKEVEAGLLPELEEVDGVVTARSRDGATTKLLPDVPLKATSCTCGAAMCRHRLAAVLAYQKVYGVAAAAVWDPGAFDDEVVRATCGEASLARAQALLGASLVVQLEPGEIPSARLPTATVQFVVPKNLVFARCDCTRAHGCEHVVLAVWAFRRAERGAVELGAPASAVPDGVLDELEVVLGRVVARGLMELGSEVELAHGRARAEREGFLWVADALEDLERQQDAWQRRSATFSASAVVSLVAEVAARLRSARGSAVPAAQVLGSGVARETMTDQLRLTPLGVRLRADGGRRFAELYLADRDTRQTYVVAKAWPEGGAAPKNGVELGELYMSSRLTLSALCRADLVVRGAMRRANGHVDLSLARGLKSSALPGQVGWGDLPAPILIDDVEAFERTSREGVPGFLGPRRVGAHVHVLAVGRVVDVSYSRGTQTLTGLVEDPAGGRYLVEVPYRAVRPGAIDATMTALSGGPRFISGELSRRRGVVLEPLAILGERLVVPDLERPTGAVSSGVEAEISDEDGWASAFDEVDELLGRGVLRGVSTVGASELAALARRLEDVGLVRLGGLVAKVNRPEGVIDLAVARLVFELAR